jgi:hypothetical protein
MRYQWLAGAFAGATLSLAVPSPAFAESASRFEVTKSAALKWEIGYLVLSAIDAGQTITCLERGICKEANPLFGKHPKARTIIAAKVIGGAAHFVLFNRLNERSPKTALRVAQISAGLQGGVVLLNARFTFH